MAIRGRIKVDMATVFPGGAFAVRVEPEEDFDKRRAGAGDTQKRDKDTGERKWIVWVIDGDEEAQRFGGSETKVSMIAPVQPVPPEAIPGTPFRPVEFDGLSIFPYVDVKRCEAKKDPQKERKCLGRVAFSIRATGMRPARTAAHTAKQAA